MIINAPETFNLKAFNDEMSPGTNGGAYRFKVGDVLDTFLVTFLVIVLEYDRY